MVDRTTYYSRLRKGRVSRRRFLGSAAAVGGGVAGLAVVGCGDDDDEVEPPDPDPTATSRPGETPEPTATARPGETPEPTATAAPTEPAVKGPVDGSYYSKIGGPGGRTLDLHRELFPTISAALGLAYSNLLIFEDPAAGTLKPDLATSLPEQPDNKTYVFKIREGVKWQNKPPADGRLLTMDDIEWNIERQRSRTLADGTEAEDFFRYNQVYKHIESVDYIDETTLSIRLSEPSAPWLLSLSLDWNGILYRDVAEEIEKDPERFSPDLVLGTGAYMYTEFAKEQVRAVRNPDYFRKAASEEVAFFDEVVGTDIGTDLNTHSAAFEQKQADLIGGSAYGRAYMDALAQATPGSEEFEIANPEKHFGVFYNYIGGPFSNENIRRAFHLGLDRQQVIDQEYAGEARRQPPVPWAYGDWAISQTELADTPGYKVDKTEDLKDARASWEAGGGEALGKLEIPSPEGYATRTDIVEWFPAMMNENLGTDIISVPFAGNPLNYLLGDEYVAMVVPSGAWGSPDPRQRFGDGHILGGALNFGKYDNPVFERMIADSLSEFDREKAVEIIHDAQRLIMNDSGAGYLFGAAGVTLYKRWPYLHSDGPYFVLIDKWVAERSWHDTTDPTFAGKPSSV